MRHDQVQLTQLLRAVTGITDSVISEEDMGLIVYQALVEYNHYRPELRLASVSDAITTVTDQPNYALPDDAVWVINVFWNPNSVLDDDDAIDDLYMKISLEYTDPMHPSELYVLYQRFAETRRFFQGDWKIINGEIWLVPVPSNTGDHVAVFYARSQTVEDLDEIKDVVFFDLCKGHLYQRAGMDLSRQSDWRAGSYAQGPGAARAWLDQAEKTLAQARSRAANPYYAETTGARTSLESQR